MANVIGIVFVVGLKKRTLLKLEKIETTLMGKKYNPINTASRYATQTAVFSMGTQ